MDQLNPSLLIPIIRSAQFPVLEAFEQGTAQVRREAGAVGGGSKFVQQMGSVAVDHAGKLVHATWDSYRSALDDLELEWTQSTRNELQGQMLGSLDESLGKLLTGIHQHGSRYPDVVAADERRIRSAMTMHGESAVAKLTIYVAKRRRQTIRGVLNEVETRLVHDGATASLIDTVREAKRESEFGAGDDGKLKQFLDTLSTGVQGMTAGHDLGLKIAQLLTWF
jgi:hypothetical protein